MGRRKAADAPGGTGTPAASVPTGDVAALAAQLAAAIAALPLEARVEALNRARSALHEVSPFKAEPVDLVLWRRAEDVTGYDEYANPNTVHRDELLLLTHSMQKNGVAMALVTHETDVDGAVVDVVVDGMHRRKHGVDAMSGLVRMLHEMGWSDDKVQKELGMEADEVARLKQITGIAALFADRDFSQAWTPADATTTDPAARSGFGM